MTALSRVNLQTPDGSSAFEAAASLVLELLFFANSKPLHRQILSWCKSFPPEKFALIMPQLVKLVNDAMAASDVGGSDMQPNTLAEPLLSLLESKPFQLPLRQAAVSCCRSGSPKLAQHHSTALASSAAGSECKHNTTVNNAPQCSYMTCL